MENIIVVLDDGETWSGLSGCHILRLPDRGEDTFDVMDHEIRDLVGEIGVPLVEALSPEGLNRL